MLTQNHDSNISITAGMDAAESFPSNGYEELLQYIQKSSPLEIKEGMAFLKANPWYVKALKADTLDRVWHGHVEELRG